MNQHSSSQPTMPPTAAPAALAAPPTRASWTGLLRLSLVVVPIKAYPAVSSAEDLTFHQLHGQCGQRIRYQKHCPVHGAVKTEAIVRGHEYTPGQYVLVEMAELDQLRPPKDRGLVLEQFVDPGQVEPALFAGRSLYLAPDGKPAQRPFGILTEALVQRGKWAVGQITMGGRRSTVVVRPTRRLLSMHMLHEPRKLRASSSLESQLHGEPGTEEERQLAATLIDAASGPLDWARFRDDTAEKLSALVEAKVQQRELVAVPEEQPVQALKLLDALKQSVAEATGTEPSDTPKRFKAGRLFRRRSA